MLAETGQSPSLTDDEIEELEAAMLALPQAECPVVHHFGPGIYIREVTLPAGIVAIGHEQLFEHLNIVLTGAAAMISDDGSIKIVRAPCIFTGKPGRKIGYILETCVWQNVYATSETDIDTLEATYLNKSQSWQAHAAAQQLQFLDEHQPDRDDFHKLIADAGFSAELVRVQSENENDQMPMPEGFGVKVTVRPSPIEGFGIFLSSPVEEGELIAPARLNGMRTPAGRYTNHSTHPNAQFIKDKFGDVYLIAMRNIAGCAGGSQGEEVTIDYRQALSLSGIFLNRGENK